MEEKKLGKKEKCGDVEEEEKRKKEPKIASPCKNVYLTVIPVHPPLVVFYFPCVLCRCDILFRPVCFCVVCRTLVSV